MRGQYPKHITRCVIRGKVFFKAQRVNGAVNRRHGEPYWQYQRHFKTLEHAIAFVTEQDDN